LKAELADSATALTEYLAAQPDVIAAYLFGSQATGRARAGSDVDVAVLLDEEDSVARFERRLREGRVVYAPRSRSEERGVSLAMP